jgi:hypothetical protein
MVWISRILMLSRCIQCQNKPGRQLTCVRQLQRSRRWGIVEGDKLERQYEWNIAYENGKTTSSQEWDMEDLRRKAHEKKEMARL